MLLQHDHATGRLPALCALIAGDLGEAGRWVVRWFDANGFRCLRSSTLEETGALLKEGRVQIVVCSLEIVGRSVKEFCAALRSLQDGTYLHIVLIAPDLSEEQRNQIIGSGADDVISLPQQFDNLRTRFSRVKRIVDFELSLKQQHDELRGQYRQLEKELGAAAKLQAELMPSDARYGEVSVKSYFLPASIISGDCQNHFMLPNNSALGYQADIAGHGVRAALLSATVLRLLTPSFCSWQDGEILKATEVLERLNQRLLSQTEIPEYFTLLLAMIDPAKGLGTVCQAGHPSPALRKPDGTIEWVGDGGFPVGMFPDVEYESWTFDFPPGSKLIMISDGIVECPDEYGDILGADKLEELLHEGSRHESQGKLPLEKYLIEKLKHRIGDSGFPDDVSILSISRGYNSGRSGSGSHDPCG